MSSVPEKIGTSLVVRGQNADKDKGFLTKYECTYLLRCRHRWYHPHQEV
jgi:hypothetical protein